MMRTALTLLSRITRQLHDPWSFRESLRRAALRGVEVNTIVDVGASDGRWSVAARRFFPNASCLLVEAQPTHEPALRRLCARDPRLTYALCAAGPQRGTTWFDVSDPFGGQAGQDSTGKQVRELPQIPLDELAQERKLQPPFLLKLDTHGYEVPILEGATEVLKQSSLIMVEVYNFQLSKESVRFPQLCGYLEERGFRCVDLADPMGRPKDGVLWQMDLLFAPADRPEFQDNSYR
jgi:FkbM family methyltransferase